MRARFSASVTTIQCQPCWLLPVGACSATSMDSLTSSSGTGRSKSRRLRTERVVVSSSSGPSGNVSVMTPNLDRSAEQRGGQSGGSVRVGLREEQRGLDELELEHQVSAVLGADQVDPGVGGHAEPGGHG